MSCVVSPDVVGDGLVFHVDAANLKSYPGSGTDVFDISSNSSDGTLAGTTGYSADNNGSFVFNGTTDNLDFANTSALNPSLSTLICWAKSDTATWTNHGFLMSKRNVFVMHPTLSSTQVLLYYFIGGAWNNVLLPAPIDITAWNMYVQSWDGTTMSGYLNGKLVVATAKTGTLNTADTGIMTIGRDEGIARFLDGNISSSMMYNRALTAAEVKQNFEALRSRFGV